MKLIKLTFTIALILTKGLVYGQNENSRGDKIPVEMTLENNRDNIIENRNVDDDGRLVKNEKSYPIVKQKFDKRGNKIQQSYYNKNNVLTVDNLGVAIWKYKYDRNNHKIYQGHFGVVGKLLPPNKNILYSEWFWKYDRKGNLISTKTKNKI